MKVIKYRVLLDEENKNILVKESAQLYASEKGLRHRSYTCVMMCCRRTVWQRSIYGCLHLIPRTNFWGCLRYRTEPSTAL